jgi:histone acetyltransferase (RNA polymerase elongator complex component)
MNQSHFNIPIFIPELACPFQCIFCNQSKISGQQKIPTKQEIIEKIESHLTTIDIENCDVRIAFFGGSFTALPIDEQIDLLLLAQKYLKENKVKGIRISTRPDYIKEENLRVLKEYGVTHIELGAQSLDEEVLLKSGRGHTVEDVKIASELILKYGFVLGLQMMIGLPGDSHEKSLKTAQRIADFGATETRIYPTLIIEGTNLHSLYKKCDYQPISLEKAVEISADLFVFFHEKSIKVLRMGLHSSVDLELGKSLIAGPFHPHFKELVMSEIWKRKFMNFDFEKDRENCEIFVPPTEINFAIGFKSSNRLFLQNIFKTVDFKTDNLLQNTDFYVHYR